MGRILLAANKVKTDVGSKLIRWYQGYCGKSLGGSEHLISFAFSFYIEKKMLFRATFEWFSS